MNRELLKQKPFFLNNEDITWVEKIFTSLTLKEKTGQLYLPLCSESSPLIIEKLIRLNPCGLHRNSFESSEILISSAILAQKKSKVPLLMSSNLEFNNLGGLSSSGTEFQTQLGVAASSDPLRFVDFMARIIAREGQALGFNLNLSPVVDIILNFQNNVVINRSFSSDPELVRELSRIYIEVLQEESMAACAKHWPGDGVDDRDQHMVTSSNSLSMEEWWASYGRIYSTVIESSVKTIMASHITLPAYFDKDELKTSKDHLLPASISRELIQNLLRGELAFNGVIISDATPMGGITSQVPRKDILPSIINGGCDIALFAIDDEFDFDSLFSAVQEGRISSERLEEAVIRVLALKASMGLHHNKNQELSIAESGKILNNEEHNRWASECIESSITLVKDNDNLIPLSPEKHSRVLLIQSNLKGIYGEELEPFIFASELQNKGFEVYLYSSETLVDPDLFDLVIYLLEQRSFLGVGNHRIPWEKLHQGASKSMMRFWHEIPCVMISMNNPFHLYDAPEVPVYINTYSSTNLVQKKLVEMLTGELPFLGGNPVDPFCGQEM